MTIRPADLLAQIDSHKAPAIVDVRSRDEYVAGHVPGALHIPFWAIGSRMSEIRSTADRAVVVYCGHGPRAWMAGTVLGLRGLRNLTYLEGHWAEWQRLGLREEAGGRVWSEGDGHRAVARALCGRVIDDDDNLNRDRSRTTQAGP